MPPELPAGYQYQYRVVPVSPYAGFWWRLLGYIIDNLILSVILGVVNQLLSIDAMTQRSIERWAHAVEFWGTSGGTASFPLPDGEFWKALAWATIVAIGFYGTYRSVFLYYLGATVGQLAVGLRVTRVGDGPAARLGWGLSLLRGFAGAALYQVLGVVNGIFAAFTSKKQTLSDMLSRTVVHKIR